MKYLYLLLLIPIGLAIYYFLKKEKNEEPLKPIELTGDEISAKITNIEANKFLITGMDYSLLLFKNDQCIFKTDEYKVNNNELLKYMEKEEIPVKRKQKDVEPINVLEDIYTCYKVRKNNINAIDSSYEATTQFLDVFYNVLIKLKLSLRTSFIIKDKELFVKDFIVFEDQLKLNKFKTDITKIMLPKLYGSISSFVDEKKISYLHISLYKYDIEERVIKDLNDYLQLYGIEITKLTFTEFSNIEDDNFKGLSSNILEKSKMNILSYSYIDKMNDEIGFHEDIKVVDELKEAKVFIK